MNSRGRDKQNASAEISDVKLINEVKIPSAVEFRQIIVTGPPCSGKSTLVEKLGGWPEEGYIDLARKRWWQDRQFSFRPREIHFGVPFLGFETSHAVFDPEWLKSPNKIAYTRVRIPPGKVGALSVDWRARYAFDFQLLSHEQVYENCRQRTRLGTHKTDARLTLARVKRAVDVYVNIALHLHKSGLIVYFRSQFDGAPRQFLSSAAN